MDVKEVSRREIESKLSGVGDYVKMDYLQACLKKQLDFDTRKFVLQKLASIYESRKMFLEAGKLIRAAADINTTYEGKVQDFLKSTELYVRAGNFDEADISLAKALASANDRQRMMVKMQVKQAYKAAATEMLNRDKRKGAMQAYEKMLTLDLDSIERKDVQNNLLHLYTKLGKVKEYYALQKAMQGPTVITPAPSTHQARAPQPMQRAPPVESNDPLSDLGIETFKAAAPAAAPQKRKFW